MKCTFAVQHHEERIMESEQMYNCSWSMWISRKQRANLMKNK